MCVCVCVYKEVVVVGYRHDNNVLITRYKLVGQKPFFCTTIILFLLLLIIDYIYLVSKKRIIHATSYCKHPFEAQISMTCFSFTHSSITQRYLTIIIRIIYTLLFK